MIAHSADSVKSYRTGESVAEDRAGTLLIPPLSRQLKRPAVRKAMILRSAESN